MRCFSQLAVFATIAFAALAAAAPVAAAPVVTPSSLLTGTLDGLRDNPSPALNSDSITTPNTTSAAPDPLVTSMSGSIVSPAVAKVSALAGSPLSPILGTTNATNGVVNTTQAVLPTFGGATNFKLENLTPSEQAALQQILSQTVGAVLQDATSVLNMLLATNSKLRQKGLGKPILGEHLVNGSVSGVADSDPTGVTPIGELVLGEYFVVFIPRDGELEQLFLDGLRLQPSGWPSLFSSRTQREGFSSDLRGLYDTHDTHDFYDTIFPLGRHSVKNIDQVSQYVSGGSGGAFG
ncbi:hypothetical protein GGX14DRAFT_405173 [Mycena pura]|uniref:Uncharacterized protein n=1 Tax=Mycena pura TaxID=153505 RepID=A0AAD6UZN8_9AGAR|nr:hypothetical protein GGX14DRAFT_405173 [Mycena pura]